MSYSSEPEAGQTGRQAESWSNLTTIMEEPEADPKAGVNQPPAAAELIEPVSDQTPEAGPQNNITTDQLTKVDTILGEFFQNSQLTSVEGNNGHLLGDMFEQNQARIKYLIEQSEADPQAKENLARLAEIQLQVGRQFGAAPNGVAIECLKILQELPGQIDSHDRIMAFVNYSGCSQSLVKVASYRRLLDQLNQQEHWQQNPALSASRDLLLEVTDQLNKKVQAALKAHTSSADSQVRKVQLQETPLEISADDNPDKLPLEGLSDLSPDHMAGWRRLASALDSLYNIYKIQAPELNQSPSEGSREWGQKTVMSLETGRHLRSIERQLHAMSEQYYKLIMCHMLIRKDKTDILNQLASTASNGVDRVTESFTGFVKSSQISSGSGIEGQLIEYLGSAGRLELTRISDYYKTELMDEKKFPQLQTT